MNRVYFIGAGPGDAELLTLRGARVLESCRAVFVPQPLEQTFAELLVGKQIFVPFDYYFAELLDLLKELIQGSPVAFLVPGDLTFYSPFQALIDALGDLAVVVPGVGTANAASAHLRKTLDLPGVCNRAVLASPRTLGDGPDAPKLGDLAAPGVTLLIYMNNLPVPELVSELLRGYGRDVPVALLHRLGLPGEEVLQATLETLESAVGDRDFFNLSGTDRRPALTLVIAGETLSGTVDGSWWNYRREHIWKHRS